MASIDIREDSEEEIDEIIFGNGEEGFLSQAVHNDDDLNQVIVFDAENRWVNISKLDLENLIAALQRAKEIWS